MTIFVSFEDFLQTKKKHKSLVSGGYEGGKHGNLKILQVFSLIQSFMLNPKVSL